MKTEKKTTPSKQTAKKELSVGKTRMLAYRLEPRILFDAAAPAMLADVAQSASDNAAYDHDASNAHNTPGDNARQADMAAQAQEESSALAALLLGKQDDNAHSSQPTGDEDNANAAPSTLDSLHASAQNFGISTAPMADSPSITVGSDPITVNEDTAGEVLKGLTVSGSGNLSLTITTANGTLGTENKTSITLTGTADEINTALQGLTFTGKKDYNGDASLSLSLSADGGTAITQTVNFQILQVNDAPTLTPTPDKSLEVKEGANNVAFTDDQFGLKDVDIASGQQTPNQIIVQINSLPEHGTLYFNGSPVVVGSSFSYDQLSGLTYTHNGSDVKVGDMDCFTVKAFDGAGGETDLTTIQIKLLPVNEAPTISGDVDIFEGQTKSLGDQITIIDEEQAHADALGNLTITVDGVDDEARGGILFFDKNGDGKYTADERIINGYTFKADQLGKLMFYHKGDEPNATAPSFTLTVKDAGGGEGADKALSVTKTFTINVKAVDDDPTLTDNRDGTTNPSQPNDYLDVGTATPITKDDLLVEDVDSKPENIVFTLTEQPKYGAIQVLVSGNWLNLAVGGRFTQAQIEAGAVRYLHHTNVPADATVDTFKFTVRDSELKAWQDSNDHTGQEGGIYEAHTDVLKVFTFHMLVDKWTGDGPGTGAGTGDLTLTGDGGKTSQAYEGKSNVIGDTLLNFTSTSGSYTLPPSEIVYRLTGLADTGSLQKLVGGTWVTLGLYDSFTQADVNAGRVQFTHDGNEKFISSFTFSVTDGANIKDNVILNVDTTPINDAPTASDGNLTAQEGVTGDETSGTVHIDGTNMGMSDVDGSDKPTANQGGVDSLWFAFSTLPQDGTLQYWNGSAWINITADMLAGKGASTLWLSKDILSITVGGFTSGIRYVHGGADDADSLKDSFQFVVRDDLSVPSAESGGALFATGKENPSDIPLTTPDGAPGTSDPTSHYQGNHLSNVGTVTVAVAAFNDAPLVPKDHGADNPTIPNTMPGGGELIGANEILYVKEGGTGTITNDLLQAIDSDNTTVQRQFKVTDQTELYGTLFLNGKALTVGSTFTQDDIDKGLVTYKHDGSENFEGYFNFEVSDGLHSTVGRFDIRVNEPLNDLPTISGPSGSLTHDSNENSGLNIGKDIVIGDPDSKEHAAPPTKDYVQVTVSADHANALLNATLNGSATMTGGNSNSLTISGTLADVQATLKSLMFSTTTGVDIDAKVKITVTVDDRLRDPDGGLTTGANGGSTNEGTKPTVGQDPNAVSTDFFVQSSIHNDAPTLSGPSGSLSAVEDTWIAAPGFSVADADAFDKTITVTVSAGHGLLNTGSGNGVKELILTGTPAEINAKLAALQYKGQPDFNGTDTITVTVNDGNNTGKDGVEGTAPAPITQTIIVTPVNDTPTVSGGPADTPNITGDYVFKAADGNAITIGDPKDLAGSSGHAPDHTPTDKYRVTITATNGGADYGTLVLTNGTLGDLNSANNIIVIEGTLAEINAALEGLTFKADNYNQDATIKLTVKVDDFGNGDPTPGTTPDSPGHTATKDFNLNISSNNDVPSVGSGSNTTGSVTATEDTKLVIKDASAGSLIAFADPDTFSSNTNYVIVTVEHGKLNVSTSTGLTVEGADTGTLKLTGTLAQINAALATLSYTGNLDYNGADTLTAVYHDNGNSGAPGATDQTCTITRDITVTAVNDAPTGTGSVTLPSINEDSAAADIPGKTVDDLVSGTFGDAKDQVSGGSASDSFTGIVIVGNAANATTQGSWQYFDGTNWVDIKTSLNATTGLVLAKDTLIRFVPVADYNGTPGGLTVRLVETGGNATTGDTQNVTGNNSGGSTHISDAANQVTIGTTVTSVNDVPTLTVPTAQNTVEDTTLSFSTANGNGITLADKDIGSGSMNVTLKVGHGTLKVAAGSGCIVGADGTGNVTLTGTLAQINAALNGLVYTVSGDYNGQDVLTISGTDAGDTFSNTVDISVSHVNDAPTGTGTVTLPNIEPGTPEANIPGQTVDELISGKFGDGKDNQWTSGNTTGSTPDAFVGIVIVDNTADAITQGSWQYFDATASSWITIDPDVDASTGLVLAKDAKIRFVPVEGYTGTPGGLTVRLVETGGNATTGMTQDVTGNNSGGLAHISDAANQITINTSVEETPITPPIDPPTPPIDPPVEPPVTPPVEPAPPITPPTAPPTAPPTPTSPVTPPMPEIVSPSYPDGITPGTGNTTGGITDGNIGSANGGADSFLPPTTDAGSLPSFDPPNLSANAPGSMDSFSPNPFRPAFGDPLGSTLSNINVADNMDTLALTLGDNRPMGWNKGVLFELELTDLRYEVGKVTQFQIPPAAVHHTNPSENLAFEVAQPDGSPLPGWITFDADNRTFSFHPPKGAEQVDIRVVARDEAGNEAETRFSFQPEDKEASGTDSSAEPNTEPSPDPSAAASATPSDLGDVMEAVLALFSPVQDGAKPAFAEQLRQHSLTDYAEFNTKIVETV